MINKHRGRTRLFKAAVATTVAATLGLGLALVGVSSASAHTGDLHVQATCNAETGNYDVSASLNIMQTGLAGETKFKVGTENFEGTPSSNAGMTGGPIASQGAGTILLTSFTLPGSTTGFGPWIYAFTKWSDTYSHGSDGQLTTPLAGNCAVPVVKDATASATTNPPTCTLPGTVDFAITNASWNDAQDTSDGSRDATAIAGHAFANGSKNTTVIYTPAAPATGTQSTDPSAPCYEAPPTIEKPMIQDYLPGTTCPAEGETRTAAFVADNTGSNVDVTYTINGTEYVVKAGEARHIEDLPVADEGTHFTITAADQKWEFDAPAVDCPPVIVPPTKIAFLPPQFEDVCGIEGDIVQVPTDAEHVTYTTNDQRKDGVGLVEVTATTDEGFVFEDGKNTHTWGKEFTNEKCGTTPPVATPPTEEPTVPAVVVPTDKPTPPATTKTVPKADATPVAKQTGQLAYTGNEGLLGVGVIALILLLAGIGIAVARKRGNL